ncbi:MAG: TonB-dependent receptor, partial [Aquificae bacterium]|nr:TonB-dependent receptor [Aquificota bacterium]
DTFYRNWYATTTMWNSMRSMYVSQYTIPDVDVVNVGLFGEYRKRLSPRLRLVAGLRVDYTRTEADDQKANTGLWQHYHGTADTSQTDFYPSGNIQLFYSLSGGLELFAGLGSAVRVPDPQERYFALDRMGSGDWLGNPGLDPERNTELDLGLKWQGAKHSLTFRTYFSYVSNYIYPYKAAQQATSYTNIDAYFTGAELYGTYALTPSLFVDGSLSYVYARKKDTYPEKNINDKDIAEIPPLTSRIALRYDTGRYFGEVETLMAATQYNVDSDLNERKTSGWAVVNLKVGGTYKGFKLLAGVRNLFDKLYYTHLSYLRNPFSSGVKVPEPGRTFYLTASYSF